MPLSATATAAAARLLAYNVSAWDASTNPYGFGKNGFRSVAVSGLAVNQMQQGLDVVIMGNEALAQANAASGFNDNAAAQASNAMGSATAALGAKADAQAARDYVARIFLGPKSVDPTVDNSGAALIDGAQYWATQFTPPRWRIYRTSTGTWADGVLITSGVSKVNGKSPDGTGNVSLLASDIPGLAGRSLLLSMIY